MIRAFGENGAEDFPLQRVGVLRLVNQRHLKSFADGLCERPARRTGQRRGQPADEVVIRLLLRLLLAPGQCLAGRAQKIQPLGERELCGQRGQFITFVKEFRIGLRHFLLFANGGADGRKRKKADRVPAAGGHFLFNKTGIQLVHRGLDDGFFGMVAVRPLFIAQEIIFQAVAIVCDVLPCQGTTAKSHLQFRNHLFAWPGRCGGQQIQFRISEKALEQRAEHVRREFLV